MNDSILAIIVGGIIGFIFIVLPALIIRAVYRRTRAAKEKKLLEPQAMSTQQEPPLEHKPTSQRRSVATLIVMTLLTVIWGLMVGFTVGVFSHLIYIVFLIPVVMGINSGKVVVEVIQRAKVRATAQLVLVSVLSAVVMYGTFHYTRYLGFQLKASMEIFSGFSEATETENLEATRLFLDYALEEETGYSGFPGYMLYEARQGATIGRLFRSSSINLGPLLIWLYWLMEFGIILGVTIQKGKKVIGRSFCESCGNWYSGEKHLGGTTVANEHLLLDLIKQKDFIELGKLLEKNAELPSTEIYFQGCEVCNGSESQLIVRRAFQGTKGILQFTDASQTILQPKDSVLLRNQLKLIQN